MADNIFPIFAVISYLFYVICSNLLTIVLNVYETFKIS